MLKESSSSDIVEYTRISITNLLPKVFENIVAGKLSFLEGIFCFSSFLCCPDNPGKLLQCILTYGTILDQCSRNHAGPIFLACRGRGLGTCDALLTLHSVLCHLIIKKIIFSCV